MKTFTEILKNLKLSEGYKYLVSLASNGVYSHDGLQHADNILATCLLKKVEIISDFSDVKTVNRNELHPEALMFDYGFGEFDHHGKAAKSFLHNGVEVPHCAFTLLCEKLGIQLDDVVGVTLRDNKGPAGCPDSIGGMLKTMQALDDTSLADLCASFYPFFSLWFESNVRLPVFITDLRKKYGKMPYCCVKKAFSSAYLQGTFCKFVISKQTDGFCCSVVPGNSFDFAAGDVEQNYPDLVYISSFMAKFKTKASAVAFAKEAINEN